MDYLAIFLEMLQARNFSANTIRSYQTYLKPYLSYLQALHLTPENVPWEVVRSFLKWIQADRCLSDRTVNMVISHLQFFWIYVLHKPWDSSQVPFRKFGRYLPFVPDRELVGRFLDSLDDPKAHLAVSILYATGMRLDELCHLKYSDIKRVAKTIHIRNSKNRSDRYVPLTASIWNRILCYWLTFPDGHRPQEWIFSQQRSMEKPMDKQWLQHVILSKRKELGIDERLCAHSFRHAYATHSYENGMDLITLQAFLGHHSINSTLIYVHLAKASCNTVENPFDQIGGGKRG